MADKDDEGKGTGKGDDGAPTDDEGKQLLGGGSGKPTGKADGRSVDDEDDEPEGADKLGDAGKRALDSMKQGRREAREARDAEKRRADELAEKLKRFEDKDKSDLERTSGERDTWKTRAEAAEARLLRRELAEELAPDHASAKVIAQVAKRMQGDDDKALRKDAEELFELLAPAPSGNGSKPPAKRVADSGGSGKPRNTSAEDEDDGEMDPLKLAALVQRRR